MAASRFAIGTTNIIQYIAEDGLTFQTFDIDAPDAGRTLDGKQLTDVVTKYQKRNARAYG